MPCGYSQKRLQDTCIVHSQTWYGGRELFGRIAQVEDGAYDFDKMTEQLEFAIS